MIKTFTIPTLLLFVLFASCVSKKQDPNGTYLIYKAESSNPLRGIGIAPGWDMDASDKLATLFQGKKYHIEFNPKYIIIKEEQSNEDIVLNKEDGDTSSTTPYKYSYIKNEQKVKLQLYNDPPISGESVRLFVSIYDKEIDSVGQPMYYRFGEIECKLARKSDK